MSHRFRNILVGIMKKNYFQAPFRGINEEFSNFWFVFDIEVSHHFSIVDAKTKSLNEQKKPHILIE